MKRKRLSIAAAITASLLAALFLLRSWALSRLPPLLESSLSSAMGTPVRVSDVEFELLPGGLSFGAQAEGIIAGRVELGFALRRNVLTMATGVMVLVLTLGAGDVWKAGEALLEILGGRSDA